jgi:putative aminopeptidase FrvX
MRIATIAVAAALLGATACVSGTAQEARPEAEAAVARTDSSDPRVRPAGQGERKEIGRYRNKKALRHVRRLAARIGVRVRATSGERRGARYIANKLEKYGYETRIQKFAVDSRRSRNVIARWPGSVKHGIVLGGHMDTVMSSPGANDNASGVGVMLELARIMAGTPQVHWVRFVAFGSEEYGRNGLHHVGSHVYVKRLGAEGRQRQAGMMSIDMIADGRPLIVGTAGIGPERVARTAFRKIKDADIAVRYEVTCDCSDNGPFEIAGIPAVFLWSGFEPNYHDSSDTVPNLKPRDMKRTGRAVRVFAKDIDRRMMAFFRRA